MIILFNILTIRMKLVKCVTSIFLTRFVKRVSFIRYKKKEMDLYIKKKKKKNRNYYSYYCAII